MNYKIAVVILNYMNYEDTLECVSCALKQTYSYYEIIVVENGSANNSYSVLLKQFKRNPRITILKSSKNLGFAKGNNLGIRYARERLKADYVFVCNNDITFQADLFDTVVSTDYTGIGVISPSVYHTDGRSQTISVQTSHIYKTIISTVTGIAIAWLRYLPGLNKRIHCIPKKPIINNVNSSKAVQYTYSIQGCSYFLTPLYFKYYNQLYPKTFLYWEEINLAVYLSKAGLTAIVIKTSPVIHKDKRSFFRLVSMKDGDIKKLKYSTDSFFSSLPMFFSRYHFIVRKYDKQKY